MMLAATFAVLIGLLLLGTGISLIVGDRIPTRGKPGLIAICQWTAEFTTALLLITGGFGLLMESAWAEPVAMIGLLMLFLTVIGTLATFCRGRRQRREWRGAGSGVLAAVLVSFLIAKGLILQK